jgi:hypothetical protein
LLLLAYRSLPANQTLPADQRWRSIELEADVFGDLDLTTGQGVAAAIRRVNDRAVSNVEPIPVGSQVYMIDTEMVEVPSWDLNLTVTQTPLPPDPPPAP